VSVLAFLGTQQIGSPAPTLTVKTLTSTLTLWAWGKVRWITGTIPTGSTLTLATLDAEDRPTALVAGQAIGWNSNNSTVIVNTVKVDTNGDVIKGANLAASHLAPLAWVMP